MVQVVSKTQLEYVIRQCNALDHCLEVIADEHLKKLPEEFAKKYKSDVVVDLQKLKEVNAFDKEAKQITVESGIKVADLMRYLDDEGFELPCLPQTYVPWEEATLNQAVA